MNYIYTFYQERKISDQILAHRFSFIEHKTSDNMLAYRASLFETKFKP